MAVIPTSAAPEKVACCLSASVLSLDPSMLASANTASRSFVSVINSALCTCSLSTRPRRTTSCSYTSSSQASSPGLIPSGFVVNLARIASS